MTHVDDIPTRTRQLISCLVEAEFLDAIECLAIALATQSERGVPLLALRMAAANARRDGRAIEVLDEIEGRYELAMKSDRA